jgi:hypothetical protein
VNNKHSRLIELFDARRTFPQNYSECQDGSPQGLVNIEQIGLIRSGIIPLTSQGAFDGQHSSTAFIAAGIEDIDFDVLIGTVFGSSVAAIPGMHLLANSVLSGSANAFLTLRVGMITKEYCRCTTRIEKKGLRRAATVRAAKLLGSIVKDGTVKLSKATLNASKSKLCPRFLVSGCRGLIKDSSRHRTKALVEPIPSLSSVGVPLRCLCSTAFLSD